MIEGGSFVCVLFVCIEIEMFFEINVNVYWCRI